MVRRCTRVELPGGGYALITRDVRRRKCKACGGDYFPEDLRECDWKLTGAKAGKTCDLLICTRCARHVGDNKDLCPAHAKVWDQHPSNPKNQEQR